MSATVWLIFKIFGTVMQSDSLNSTTVKKLIQKSRMATAAILKKPLNLHIAATV